MAFGVKQTNIVKGFAIVMMLFLHLFEPMATFDIARVSYAPFPPGLVNQYAIVGQACVSIFAFLSAYGITRSEREKAALPADGRNVAYRAVYRLVSLWGGFFVIFALAQCFSFLGRHALGHTTASVYFTGGKLQGALHFLLDGLGLADVMGTPTFNMTWWYMPVAYGIILCLPLLLAAYKKLRFLLVPAGFLLPLLLAPGNVFAFRLFLVSLAIWAASEDVFERLDTALKKRGAFVRLLVFLGLLLLLAVSAHGKASERDLFGIWDNIFSVNFIVFCYLFLARIPLVVPVFEFLGRHSMNIFLTHTFILFYYFSGLLYPLRHFLFIWLGLIVLSLLGSIVLEALKKWTRYNGAVAFLAGKLAGLCLPGKDAAPATPAGE